MPYRKRTKDQLHLKSRVRALSYTLQFEIMSYSYPFFLDFIPIALGYKFADTFVPADQANLSSGGSRIDFQRCYQACKASFLSNSFRRRKGRKEYNARDACVIAEAADASGELPAGLKLEDPGVLLTPGNKDGQIKVIREEGVGMAYSWDSAS